MGLITLTEAKAKLLVRFQNRTEFQSIGSVDYFGVWLNDALTQLTASDRIPFAKRPIRFPELETSTDVSTADGVPYISVPGDCLKPFHVYDKTNGRRLDWIPLKQYVEYTDRADTGAEGPPSEWHRAGLRIYLHSTPDAIYVMEVWYKKRHPLWEGDNATLIGSEWDEPILELAAYKAHSWVGEFDRAKAAKEAYMELIVPLLTNAFADEKERNEYWRPDDQYFRK